MSRADIERRVDELAARYDGAAFADAVREYSDTLDPGSRGELKVVLLQRARALEDAMDERFEAKGWFRRTFGRMGDPDRERRKR